MKVKQRSTTVYQESILPLCNGQEHATPSLHGNDRLHFGDYLGRC